MNEPKLRTPEEWLGQLVFSLKGVPEHAIYDIQRNAIAYARWKALTEAASEMRVWMSGIQCHREILKLRDAAMEKGSK